MANSSHKARSWATPSTEAILTRVQEAEARLSPRYCGMVINDAWAYCNVELDLCLGVPEHRTAQWGQEAIWVLHCHKHGDITWDRTEVAPIVHPNHRPHG